MDGDERRQLLVEEIRAHTAAIKAGGYLVKGSRGQDVLHPSLAARRACLEALRKLEGKEPPAPASELDAFLTTARR